MTYTEMAQHLLLNTHNKMTLAEDLGISRPTLDTRLDKGNWKKGEKRIITDLYKNATNP